ncbi:MAG: hypothetical protein ACI9VR_004069 [Cognaticolwellia sp.]|jgi:hypothetical protein
MIWFFLACGPVFVDFDDTQDSGEVNLGLPDGQWSLGQPDDGFGWAMHWDGQRLYMSAPGSGSLASVAGDGPLVEEEKIGLGDGSSLHSHQGVLFVSQSLSQGGKGVLPDGTTGEGASARAQLSMEEDHWVLDGHGIWQAGSHEDLGLWASALVEYEGQWIVSTSQGSPALRTQSGLTLERISVLDEAGASMVTCDVDDDGSQELVLGAPGSGQIYIYSALDASPQLLGTGEGRFGQSLACGAEGLAIGAPMESEGQGAVYQLNGQDLVRIYEGAGHAGNTLLAAEEGLFVAETGAMATDFGLVLRLY